MLRPIASFGRWAPGSDQDSARDQQNACPRPIRGRGPVFRTDQTRKNSCRGNTRVMANVVAVGAQWGDEGKGKIVDWLSEQADIVVRFQGGHNAGHTLVINGETYKLALLPSGVLRPSKLAVIGNGVVFDPQAFLDEVAKLKGQGVAVSPENLRVAENVTLILPLHRALDALRESSNSGTAIGTPTRV